MNEYLLACIQCFNKAANHLETAVLPDVTDSQTRQGIEFCITYAKQGATNIETFGKETEKPS